MLYGATVRSSVARGKIKKISFGSSVDWNEFVVVTAKDIPGNNCIALITDDQPCLAAETVNHPEEPILLLAHSDRRKLRKAVEAVSIEYEPIPSVHTIEDSAQKSTIIWGADNTFKSYLIEKGRQAGETRLRPHGGHGGDSEAASFANARSRRRERGREDSRRRDRVHHRWWRVRNAVFGGPFARHDPCRRSLLLAERAHSNEGDGDEHAAARGFSRVRRAAEPVCDGAPHGPHRPGRGSFSGRNSPEKFSEAGPDHNDRTDHSRRYRSGSFA